MHIHTHTHVYTHTHTVCEENEFINYSLEFQKHFKASKECFPKVILMINT